MTAERPHVPAPVVARLRAICMRLPEAREDDAWTGTAWRIRKKTFAHVLEVNGGWPPAYARAVGEDGPLTILTFRSAGPELNALRNTGRPFVAPMWRQDEVGLVLGSAPDWEEVAELLTESYCLQAPHRLAAQVERP